MKKNRYQDLDNLAYTRVTEKVLLKKMMPDESGTASDAYVEKDYKKGGIVVVVIIAIIVVTGLAKLIFGF